MNEQPTSETLKQLTRPTVVEFWAPWCAPCRRQRHHLGALSGEYGDRVDLLEVNADEAPELVRDLEVRSIPTLLVFWGGQERLRLVGAQAPSPLAIDLRIRLGGRRSTAVWAFANRSPPAAWHRVGLAGHRPGRRTSLDPHPGGRFGALLGGP